jgi:hypothetical protein
MYANITPSNYGYGKMNLTKDNTCQTVSIIGNTVKAKTLQATIDGEPAKYVHRILGGKIVEDNCDVFLQNNIAADSTTLIGDNTSYPGGKLYNNTTVSASDPQVGDDRMHGEDFIYDAEDDDDEPCSQWPQWPQWPQCPECPKCPVGYHLVGGKCVVDTCAEGEEWSPGVGCHKKDSNPVTPPAPYPVVPPGTPSHPNPPNSPNHPNPAPDKPTDTCCGCCIIQQITTTTSMSPSSFCCRCGDGRLTKLQFRQA